MNILKSIVVCIRNILDDENKLGHRSGIVIQLSKKVRIFRISSLLALSKIYNYFGAPWDYGTAFASKTNSILNNFIISNSKNPFENRGW